MPRPSPARTGLDRHCIGGSSPSSGELEIFCSDQDSVPDVRRVTSMNFSPLAGTSDAMAFLGLNQVGLSTLLTEKCPFARSRAVTLS